MKKRKLASKVSAVLVGAVLGTDISVLLTGTSAIEPENVIALVAIIVIALEFVDEARWARQVNRFACALIAGVAVREYTQMTMKTCFILSVITIAVMVIAVAIKGMCKTTTSGNGGQHTGN